MRLLIFTVTVFFVGLWVCANLYLLGIVTIESFPTKLTPPVNTAEYGDSLGILNGLFSAVAIVFALIAVLLQGKELKESTSAQYNQALTMQDQLDSQKRSIRLNILAVRLQYLLSEAARTDTIINNIEGDHNKSDLFHNCVDKKKRCLNQAEQIDFKIEHLLNSTDN